MDLNVWAFVILLSQYSVSHRPRVSGIISNNTTFYYRKLPVAPSVRATIDFSVFYPKNSYKEPVINMYTTYPAINIEKRCSYIRYGQLINKNLHEHLDVGQHDAVTCEWFGADTVSCRGRVTVQDYIPRNFSLSFGFHCDWLPINSLKGLQYNISFTKQSNETNSCINYLHLRKLKCAVRFTITPLFLILLGMNVWLKFKNLYNIFKHMKLLLSWGEDVINIWRKYYVMESYEV